MDKKVKGISISNDESYKRHKLAELVPLDTPMSIEFAPTTCCNLKCIFCAHSSLGAAYNNILGKTIDLELVKKTILDIKNFPRKLKALHFVGIGEPLLHKDIDKMIHFAKEADIAEKIDIVTNGICLTKEKVDAIVGGGVDFIRISLNGLSSEDYEKYTQTKINFNEYVENIKYLYNNRKQCKIYIKIFNFMVDTEEKKKFFYDTFEPICDSINIEYYNECFVDTKGRKELQDTNKNHRGEDSPVARVCSQPFLRLIVLANGDCSPCSEPLFPVSFGNVKNTSICDIWNSKKLDNFRIEMINGREKSNAICKECKPIKINSYSDDNIDTEAVRLREFYSNR